MPPALMVTGSARLEALLKPGDSLASRNSQFRLHWLDFKEAALTFSGMDKTENFNRLMTIDGFPESF